MVSAVGTGSVLFTPRVASLYQYTLLWLIPSVCALMWVMIREAGRYSIVTGRTVLEGFEQLPGPHNWAVWLTFVPQLVAAVAGIGGLASLVGSALSSAVGGDHTIWGVAFIVVAGTLVAAGGYRRVEQVARVLAGLLLLVAVLAAVQVAPGAGALAQGLVPRIPEDPDLYVIVPWIGTILAGSMGIVWFSYWTAARGYGGVPATRQDDQMAEADGTAVTSGEDRVARLTSWIRTMGLAAAVGVLGGGVVLVAFMVLGAELLAPAGIVPQGVDVAEDLSRLLADVWGRSGYWLMIVGVLIALGGSVLANQDGWGRSFADMTLVLARGRRLPWRLGDRRTLKRLYVLVPTGLAPIVVVLVVRDPVTIMSVSGIVAALHTPFIVALIAWVNRRQLPVSLRPGMIVTSAMVLSAVFFAGVGTLQLLSL